MGPHTKNNIESIRSSESDHSIWFLVEVTVWFGLLSSLVEVSVLTLERRFWHTIMQLSRDYAWMAPLAQVMLLLIVATLLFLLSRLWRTIGPLPLVIFASSLLGFLNLLMLVPRLQHVAALVLAAGLALQTARFIKSRVAAFQALVRRTLLWMVGLVVGLALSVQSVGVLRERQALAHLPPAPANAPNVLFITMDTVRAPSLSLYGYSRSTTPQLERIAHAGVIFDRAIATASWTLPSHASMFTGRFPHELSVDWETPLDQSYLTLAEFLSARGYHTAGFVANTGYCSYESGLQQGFAHYQDYRISLGEIVASSTLTRTIVNNFRIRRVFRNDELLSRQSAEQINREFLRWLSRKGRRPFFAFLNYYDAHSPYLPPPPFDRKFGPGRRHGKVSPRQRGWLSPGELSEEAIQEETDAYDGSIAYLDHQIGLLLDELEKQGVLYNTLVIVTSDHGEEFGAHRISGYGRIFGHGNTLFLSELHVPLLFLFHSRIPQGSRVHDQITLRDLPATVVDLLNLTDQRYFPGNSLARYWSITPDPGSQGRSPLLSELTLARNLPPWYPASKADMKSLVAGRYHYIRYRNGREELYDLENDVNEERDLASSQEGGQVLYQLRLSLDKALSYKR